LKYLKKIIKIVLFLLLFYVGYGLIYGNFHKLDRDAYRSAQLFSFNMPYYIEKYKIKTVINLRGEQKSKSWYQNERRVTREHNVTLTTFKMSSRKYLDFNRTSALVKILKDAKKPILIHCEGGADRTSLASALYLYGVKGKSAEEARGELSFIYGHLPSIRPEVIAMDRSFDNFVKNSPNP
jgi:protein tyrosine/serine phosphatase